MKKFLTIIVLITLAACGTLKPSAPESSGTKHVSPKEALKDLRLGCVAVKGVKDSDHGKIYYTEKHNLYKYVSLNTRQGDKGFCTTAQAESAGFRPAPQHFSGSVYYFLQDLHNEGSMGKNHDYVAGIFKSLHIYDKVCGNPSKTEMVNAVESYANRERDAMDSGKYQGVTAALIHRYRCH